MKRRKNSVQSSRGRLRRVVVVGAGPAGLMTAWRLCEQKIPVLLVSRMPARRSGATAVQEGINGAFGSDEDDSPQAHFEDSIAASEFLAEQPPVRGMTETAPRLIELLTAMGVPFSRTPDGRLAAGHLGGSRHARTVSVASTVGQHVVAALDQQLRRLETLDATDERGVAIPGEKLLERLEAHDLLSLVLDDDGVVSGVVTADVRSLRVQAFPGDAVCLATGGYGGLFGRTTSGAADLGTGMALAFRQGAVLANPEFVQIHPTALAGTPTAPALSVALLTAGARLWVPKSASESRPPSEIPERERHYLLEEAAAQPADLLPGTVARTLLRALPAGRSEAEQPAAAQARAYLDVTHLASSPAGRSIRPMLELYRKLTGLDPFFEPIRVFPAVHGSLGGLWVDYEAGRDGTLALDSPRNHATSLPGLYACGAAAYQYHGARRLPGNELLSALYGGLLGAGGISAYRDAQRRSAFDLPGSVFERQEAAARESLEALLERASQGEGDSPFAIRDELGALLDRGLFAERDDATLDEVVAATEALEKKLGRAKLADRSTHMNHSLELLRQLEAVLPVARATALAARRRDECRGNHFKPAASAKGRDDANWLKTTLMRKSGDRDVQFLSEIEYACAGSTVRATEAVNTSLMAPDRWAPGQAPAAEEGSE